MGEAVPHKRMRKQKRSAKLDDGGTQRKGKSGAEAPGNAQYSRFFRWVEKAARPRLKPEARERAGFGLPRA